MNRRPGIRTVCDYGSRVPPDHLIILSPTQVLAASDAPEAKTFLQEVSCLLRLAQGELHARSPTLIDLSFAARGCRVNALCFAPNL
jgi:hypothetical protein